MRLYLQLHEAIQVFLAGCQVSKLRLLLNHFFWDVIKGSEIKGV